MQELGGVNRREPIVKSRDNVVSGSGKSVLMCRLIGLLRNGLASVQGCAGAAAAFNRALDALARALVLWTAAAARFFDPGQ